MKKVVVAEASPTIKSVADSLLRQHGYDVICTSDGLQALEVISAERPDLVLAGVGLSGITGLQLCKQISTDRLTGGIPIVLMIGARDSVSEEDVVESGARGKLRKPFSPKDLLEIVEKLAGQSARPAQQGEPLTANPPSATKFISQISSTQHLHKGSESFNLEWLDLADKSSTKPMASKVASLDLSTDDQGLIIEDDQYGLSRQPEPEETAQIAQNKDEDYEWFIGEIKREIENKPRPEKAETPAAPKKDIPSFGISAGDVIKFDDLRPAGSEKESPDGEKTSLSKGFDASWQGSEIEHVAAGNLRPQSPISKTMTDEEMSILADRVAARLAANIVAGLDKNRIIEAIKAIIEP